MSLCSPVYLGQFLQPPTPHPDTQASVLCVGYLQSPTLSFPASPHLLHVLPGDEATVAAWGVGLAYGMIAGGELATAVSKAAADAIGKYNCEQVQPLLAGDPPPFTPSHKACSFDAWPVHSCVVAVRCVCV